MKTEELNVKEAYEVPELEVIEMESEGVVAGSTPGGLDEDEEWG